MFGKNFRRGCEPGQFAVELVFHDLLCAEPEALQVADSFREVVLENTRGFLQVVTYFLFYILHFLAHLHEVYT